VSSSDEIDVMRVGLRALEIASMTHDAPLDKHYFISSGMVLHGGSLEVSRAEKQVTVKTDLDWSACVPSGYPAVRCNLSEGWGTSRSRGARLSVFLIGQRGYPTRLSRPDVERVE
jgi:hypothetical protein